MGERGRPSEPNVAQVVPLLRVRSLGDRSFDYLIPEQLSDLMKVGSLVGIPFARRNVRGVVVGTSCVSTTTSELRSVETVEEWGVPDDLMVLAARLAKRYIAPLETCLRLVAPPAPGKGKVVRRASGEDWLFRVGPGADGGDSARERLTFKQESLLSQIPTEGVPYRTALAQADVGNSVMTTLIRKGLVRRAPAPPASANIGGGLTVGADRSWPMLSAEQEEAVATLVADLQRRSFRQRQLWGVTGSGKTEVYLHLTRAALAIGGGVILLVPEIALTSLMIERVRARFGESVGVIHSGLTPAQRRLQYRRVATGEARVVIGARSAIFAPVDDLRLIIIDESHDNSYKQEEAPGYNSRTVARMRLENTGGLLLEGSASPAVEAIGESSSCVRMRERVRGALPECEVVDMRHRGGSGALAGVTKEAIAETVRRGEQAIVLLNRRGYSGHVHCDSCGHVMMCDDCEMSLTYHDQSKRLLCHHCGRSYVQPGVCPACSEQPLARGGPGTERVAEEMARLVHKDSVYRLDSDVITSGSRVQGILDAFASSRPGILVGTQMVAKGHDFPDVTLVVVVDADMGLYVPDFRAAERTYQLLTQVSGRAGRAERPGRVVIQTWNPDVPCIRMALDREDEAFYLREAAIRERLGYPPYTELIRLVVSGEQAPTVQKAAEHLTERLGQHFEGDEVRGPARLASLRGKKRWHVVVSSRDGERARVIVAQAVGQLSGPYRKRGVSLLVDVDPYTFV